MKLSTKRALLVVITVCLLFTLLSCAAEPDITYVASEHGTLSGEADGVLYGNASENFDITVYPCRLVTENGEKNIVYKLSITNDSEKEFKDLTATLVMNSKLDKYIAAGVVPLPFTSVDFAAKSETDIEDAECIGVDIGFQQLLSDEEIMKEAGISYDDIPALAENFELHIEWDGGKEYYMFETQVINEL